MKELKKKLHGDLSLFVVPARAWMLLKSLKAGLWPEIRSWPDSIFYIICVNAEERLGKSLTVHIVEPKKYFLYMV